MTKRNRFVSTVVARIAVLLFAMCGAAACRSVVSWGQVSCAGCNDSAVVSALLAVNAGSAGPVISDIRVLTPGDIGQYGRFELSFDISTVATNPYFPYDGNPPPGVEPAAGITVDALLLAPGETDWSNAKILPCFYYQPVEEVGTGGNAALLPVGEAEWRCRFTPEEIGAWQYKMRVTDAGGTSESPESSFDCVDCTGDNCRGFVRVSQSDPRFFEFSNGEPFVTPLITMEQGSPFNTLARIRTGIPALGNNGARFVRWFPTGEGANYFVAPYGDDIRINWAFGGARVYYDDVDTQAGKLFSFRPYYYSTQPIPVEVGQYRLSFVGKVEGEQVMRMQVGNAFEDVCSSTCTYHEANGGVCAYKQDGWNAYSLEMTSSSETSLAVGVRGLYVSSDAPAPFNTVLGGKIRLHSMQFQRFEDDRGEWSADLLTRGDPDTHTYVDQRSAARLDEILRLSEQYGVYHKLTVFHKNDFVLNRFQPDGTIGGFYQCSWGWCPVNFYSADGQAARWYEDAYTRYFVARWAYSPALHSLELANECGWYEDPRDPGGGRILSFDAGWHLAELVYQLSPRRVLTTNSFWGHFINDFFDDPVYGHLIDYGDKHWYASVNQTDGEVISNVWNDSAAYVRECYSRFQDYRDWQSIPKPIVRGEGGVAESGTEPQHPEVALESQGTWYHKKLWAHVGVLGYTCDGEWYPRMFVPYEEGQFPNSEHDLFKIFSAYERFIQGEPLSNGLHEEIGTDLESDRQILLTESTGDVRAWGSRDGINGGVLLWIDNANHTWKNAVDGVVIPSVSATLTVQGLPSGTYAAEWWDTSTGTVIQTESFSVGADEELAFGVADLPTDIAVKFALLESAVVLDKTVAPRSGSQGDSVTYTLSFVGTGNALFLTDTLPSATGPPVILPPEGTGVIPTYDLDQHRIRWSDSPALGQEVTIRYTVTITSSASQALVNTAQLRDASGDVSTATATVIANPYRVYLPLILKGS